MVDDNTNYLFFDTETSGLPLDWYASKSKTDVWPRIVQIAWLLCDENGTILSEFQTVIKPDGWGIDPGAIDCHGITLEYAMNHGVDIVPVLEKFIEEVNSVDILIAHNVLFDSLIVQAECIRAKIRENIDKKRKYCTMKQSTKFCGILGLFDKLKYPSLMELHNKLFNEHFEDAHDAMVDVKSCARCYFELKRLNVA